MNKLLTLILTIPALFLSYTAYIGLMCVFISLSILTLIASDKGGENGFG